MIDLKSHTLTRQSAEHDVNIHGLLCFVLFVLLVESVSLLFSNVGSATSDTPKVCAFQRYAGTLDVAWRGSMIETEPSERAAAITGALCILPNVAPYTKH